MKSEIRILSIRQPWAYLITAGIKAIENRIWTTGYRGPVLIHAARRPAETSIQQIERKFRVVVPRDLRRGGVVGIAGIADVLTSSDNPFFEGPYGFALVGAQMLPFMPCAGALGLRVAPPSLAERVEQRILAQVRAAVHAANAARSTLCSDRPNFAAPHRRRIRSKRLPT
jgi:hypothetical protein